MQAFPVQVKPVRATPAQEKPFLDKKAPKAGNLERYLAGRLHRADAAQTCPNRGVSRGDRGGVRGCCGVVLSYNFLPESKTYIPVRWAFPVCEPRDVSIPILQ